jgi:hypothetical protein
VLLDAEPRETLPGSGKSASCCGVQSKLIPLQSFAEASFDRKARGNVRCALENVAIGAIGAQQRGQRRQVRSEPIVHVELDLWKCVRREQKTSKVCHDN